MSKVILAVFMIVLFTTTGCLMQRAGKTNELYALWYGQASLVGLSAEMKLAGYKWQGDIFNYTPWTDTDAPPEVVFKNGGGNCGDWARFFQDFAEYRVMIGKPVCDEYYGYLLRNGFDWHYITIFKIGDKWYCQSNLDFEEVRDKKDALDNWWNDKFEYQAVVKEWKR